MKHGRKLRQDQKQRHHHLRVRVTKATTDKRVLRCRTPHKFVGIHLEREKSTLHYSDSPLQRFSGVYDSNTNLSNEHASTVSLVLAPHTGLVNPHFHVKWDDLDEERWKVAGDHANPQNQSGERATTTITKDSRNNDNRVVK